MTNTQHKLLITGGTGYIGSNLINHIQLSNKDSYLITVIDRSIKEQNLNDLEEIKFIEFNLATNSSPDSKLKEAIKSTDLLIHSSYLGGYEAENSFLDFILDINPKVKLIYLSSAAVYGESNKINQTSDTALKPINDYGIAKIKTEEYIKNKFSNYLIFRIANPYGKEKATKGFYRIILEKLKQGHRKISLNADYSRQIIRDFIYIDDLCKVIIELIQASNNETYNISSGKGISLEEFTYQTAAELGIPKEEIEFEYNGCKHGEIKYSVLDNEKAHKAHKALKL